MRKVTSCLLLAFGIAFLLLCVMSCDNSDTDIIGNSGKDRVSLLREEIEKMDTLGKEELDKQIGERYRTLGMAQYLGCGNDPESMYSICETAIRMKKAHVIDSLLRVSMGSEERELFMYRCLEGKLYVEEQRRKWAESIDYKRKEYLIGMIQYLRDPKGAAKRIIADDEYTIRSRCYAAAVISRLGAMEDVEYLKQFYGKINPRESKIPIGFKEIFVVPEVKGSEKKGCSDCARDAAIVIKERLDLKQAN